MSKILVTGSTGFIGKALCDHLSSLGFEVVGLSTKDGDISDPSFFSEHLHDDLSHAFHLASKNYVPDSWKNPASFYHANVMGAQNVLEFCKTKKLNLTYVSAYLYGVPEKLPVSETHRILPNNPYAHSKYLAEQLCEFYSREFTMNITAIRPFNVFGTGQRDIFLIPKIIRQALEEDSIKVMDLAPKRDYIFIDDLINALILSMNCKNGFSVYNIGSGISMSVKEIIDSIQHILNTRKPVYSENKSRENELADVVADISRAKSELGWTPKVSFEDGIKRLITASHT